MSIGVKSDSREHVLAQEPCRLYLFASRPRTSGLSTFALCLSTTEPDCSCNASTAEALAKGNHYCKQVRAYHPYFPRSRPVRCLPLLPAAAAFALRTSRSRSLMRCGRAMGHHNWRWEVTDVWARKLGGCFWSVCWNASRPARMLASSCCSPSLISGVTFVLE